MPETEQQNAGSADEATQGGEAARDFSWVEATVWTKRMLSALVNGVKGGKWYALMDKVFAPDTLVAAWTKVRANKGAAGVDGQSISTPIRKPSKVSTDSPADGYAPFFADRRRRRRAWESAAPITNAGQMPSSRKPGCSHFTRPGCCRRDSLDERNSRLESRMRENRTYGSEGGEARAFPTPISTVMMKPSLIPASR
jgi:hypothetical protein